MSKEAKARIKINDLLKEAGWRFFDDENGKANIVLENNVKITRQSLDEAGENFEKVSNGFVDYLLLDDRGFPFIVLEAKSESKHALVGKEQARKYAASQHCRFIILSNGNSHYFWDTKRGNPVAITKFPSPDTVEGYAGFEPNPQALIRENVAADYIAVTQKHDYQNDPSWINENLRDEFVQINQLRFLRPYQLNAVKAIQSSVKEGKDRFLFEMATGTGKTLVSAAVIKLFLRTANARRVLFLVDRLELENQAGKAFKDYLKNDYQTVIFKENRDDWRKAEIVVSTIQSFMTNNKYKRLFAPDDFDLVISDEAHRSIGGNSRAVFEYFIGYKLGLTATPRDYLKNFKNTNPNDPREWERRILLDTYQTFGCENGNPTYRYSLLDGVKDGFLINPIVVDARTEITAQLLSDEGYAVLQTIEDETGETSEEVEETFIHKDFEKRFFSETTNQVFCETFLQNALRDPISDEIGKSIIFCVSQNHAAKITQLLNEIASKAFPDKYQSNFAVQVTSVIPDAQQYAMNFTNNNLLGSENIITGYKTSKARVCVTVGMMTTGYDCPDILNLALMRPIFSPTDFIQIKGRGTRRHNFSNQIADPKWKKNVGDVQKTQFKLFDFFANCEYFEEDFNYDEILKLPKIKSGSEGPGPDPENPPIPFAYENMRRDILTIREERQIGLEGMRVDRMYFQKFEEQIKQDDFAIEKAKIGDIESILRHIEENVFDKPEDYFNLEKLRKSLTVDRRVTLREIVEVIFGLKPYFKNREELLEDEFEKFDSRFMPEESQFKSAKNFFKTYISDPQFRLMVDEGNFALIMGTHAGGEFLRTLSVDLRKQIIEYIKDYIPFNQFT